VPLVRSHRPTVSPDAEGHDGEEDAHAPCQGLHHVRGRSRDAARLSFADSTFDFVVAYNSLMDVKDMPGSVREAARVLERGGRFCICVTHPWRTRGSSRAMTPLLPSSSRARTWGAGLSRERSSEMSSPPRSGAGRAHSGSGPRRWDVRAEMFDERSVVLPGGVGPDLQRLVRLRQRLRLRPNARFERGPDKNRGNLFHQGFHQP